MNTKCPKCGKQKPASAYYNRTTCVRFPCKACISAYRKIYYRKHKTHILAMEHAYRLAHLEKVRKQVRESQHRRPMDEQVAYHRKWRHANMKHFRRIRHFWYAVAKAIKLGILKRKPCEVCGKKLSHAHHSDYVNGKELDVRFLCALHHRQKHLHMIN